MKKVIVSASAIALLAGVLSLTRDALSQQEKAIAPNVPHKVGLIDMAYVFKHYKKFETLREDLKVEIATSEEKAKMMQQETQTLQAQLKTFAEGSTEYAKIEKQLVQKAADFEGFRRQMSREFLKKESQIYLQVYNEVSTMVTKYAEHFKYTLVMRFNREELDTENPQQLLQGMNRQVVYYRADDDITEQVLKELNRKLGNSESAKPKADRDSDAATDRAEPPVRKNASKPKPNNNN